MGGEIKHGGKRFDAYAQSYTKLVVSVAIRETAPFCLNLRFHQNRENHGVAFGSLPDVFS